KSRATTGGAFAAATKWPPAASGAGVCKKGFPNLHSRLSSGSRPARRLARIPACWAAGHRPVRMHIQEFTRAYESLIRAENLDFREIGPITSGVAREDCKLFNTGMGANIEIRQRRVPGSAPAAISKETLARQKSSFPRQRFPRIRVDGKSRIQF